MSLHFIRINCLGMFLRQVKVYPSIHQRRPIFGNTIHDNIINDGYSMLYSIRNAPVSGVLN